MSASVKLRQLESKLSTLQIHHQHLLKERQQEIATLITSLDLAPIEDTLLLGGLLFLKNKITAQDSITEDWRDAGMRFLRRTKPKTSNSSKKATTPNPTPKSVAKHPQSREKQNEKTTELTS